MMKNTAEITKEDCLLQDLTLGLERRKFKKKYGSKLTADLKRYNLIEKDANNRYFLSLPGRDFAKLNLTEYVDDEETEDYLLSYFYERSNKHNFTLTFLGMILMVFLFYLLFVPEALEQMGISI